LNLWSAITGKEINIYAIDINDANINTIVNKQGKANWAIAKPDSTATAPTEAKKSMQLKLNHYSLHNAYIKYSDYAGNMFLDISNIEHSGSGDFTADIFTLVTKTNIEKLSYSMGGVKYFADVKTNADIDLQIDTKQMKFTFNTDKINLNDLKISYKRILSTCE